MPIAAPAAASYADAPPSALASAQKAPVISSIIKVKLLFTPLPPHFNMLRSFLAVGCGCFVGGILRYLLTLLLPGAADGRFPWSTFAANALGCLLIGLLSGWLARIAAPDTLRLFLTVGLCGGFTTFSTFVADGRALWQQQLTLTAVAYLCSSLIVGFALLGLGHRLAA